MTEQLTKQSIGVGVAGTGFIGPVHIEALRRNGITVLGLVLEVKNNRAVKRCVEEYNENLGNTGLLHRFDFDYGMDRRGLYVGLRF